MITLAAVMHVYEVRPRKDKRGVESAMNFQSLTNPTISVVVLSRLRRTVKRD